MKINVAKKKFLLCFRPTIDAEPIELGNNNNNKHARRKVLFPKTSSTNHENGRTRKPSISRFFKNVLLGNGLTKRLRKRRKSTKNSESTLTKEPPTKFAKDINRTFTTEEGTNNEDAVFSLSPSTSLYSFMTQETHYGDGGGGCFKVEAVEQERVLRWPQMSKRSKVTNYIKRTFISAISHRYVIYTLLAIFGVTVFWRFNGIFLTCVWLYLAGGPLTPVLSGDRQPTNRRRTFLM